MTVCLDLISRLQEYCLVFNSHCSKMSWSRPSHQYSLLFIHWVVPGIVWFKLPAVFYSSCPFFFSSWLSDCEYTAVEYFTWLWFINKPWGFCYIQETHYTWMVQSKKKKANIDWHMHWNEVSVKHVATVPRSHSRGNIAENTEARLLLRWIQTASSYPDFK